MTKRVRAICGRVGRNCYIESIERECETCKHKVLVSPATLVDIGKNNAEIICMECFIENSFHETEIEISPEQAQELEMMFTENKA